MNYEAEESWSDDTLSVLCDYTESLGERLCWSDVSWAVKDRKPEVLNV